MSILAEIIMHRRGGDGTPMKMSGEYLKDQLSETSHTD
jgi:xanthine/CO dehydrogenase XdhC/CoxF family maturation factor